MSQSQPAGTLPDRPCLEQYRRRAKEIAKRARLGEADAIDFLQIHAPGSLNKPKLRLTDAQHALARSLGAQSWPKLVVGILEAEANDFFKSVGDGSLEEVKRFLGCAPELARRADAEGQTALQMAAEYGHTALIEPLIRAGAEMSRRFGRSAHTALSWAVTVGSLDCARELIRLGDSPDLFCAAGMGELDLVKGFWVGDRLKPNSSQTGSSRTTEDGTPLPRPPETDEELVGDALYIAARHGRTEVVRFLLERGADPNFRGYMGGTPLHWAEFSANGDVSSLLREAEGSDDLLDYSFGATPPAFGVTFAAVSDIMSRCLRAIVDRRPESVHEMSRVGTPLHAAAWSGQAGNAAFLLERGADRSKKNAEGLTAYDVAFARGHEELAQMLQ